MGKQFSWSQLVKPPVKREKSNKSSAKRTAKQVKECLQLDQLFWMQTTRKKLSQPLEKLDKNWYCQVLKCAKYSQVGDSFIDPKQNIKCVRIDRPHIHETKVLKPPVAIKKPLIKRVIVIKKAPKLEPPPPQQQQQPHYDTNRASPSSSIDGHSSTGSSEAGSLLSVREIVRQAQRFRPKMEMSPLCYSNPVDAYKPPQENIDVLNYDFSFTSPLIRS